MSKTEVMGVRVGRADWDEFGARCIEAGTTRNAKLNDFIRGYNRQAANLPTEDDAFIYLTPKQRARAQAAKNELAKAITDQIASDKPIGFDASTGEPIFKRGVGPQKGKK